MNESQDEKPPPSEESGEQLQPDGTGGLHSGTVCSDDARRREVVTIRDITGFKPRSWYHYSPLIYKDGKVYCF